MNIIDYLRAQGTALVDAAQSNVRGMLVSFGEKCAQLEALYAWHYAVREKMGADYPYNAYFDKLSSAVVDSRSMRMILLRAFNVVGAYPQDYGIPTYGLNIADVKKINPQFVGVPQAVLIGAAVLLSVALLADLIGVLLAEKSAYDLYGALVAQYKAEGMTQAQAEAKAKQTLDDVKAKAGIDIGGTLDKIGGIIKIGGLIWAAKELLG